MAFRDYLARLRELVGQARGRGLSDRALVDVVMPQLGAPYRQWNYFDDFVGDNILQMNEELEGRKRVPQSPQRWEPNRPPSKKISDR